MSGTKFTPGPWDVIGTTVFKLDETRSCNRFSCNVQGGFVERASGWSPHNRTSDQECEANAHLIAAAPELYDALEEVRRVGDDKMAFVSEWAAAVQKADAALAKARGEKADG